MSHPATTRRAASQTRLEQKAPPGRPRLGIDQSTLPLSSEHRTSREIKAALNAIPAGSVTARTAGALRVDGSRRKIEDERAAFEQAVAEENSRPTEG